MFGEFDESYCLKYINSGVLGFETDKGGHMKQKDGKPIPITISRTTYYRYREYFAKPESVTEELHEFARSRYTHEILNILSLLKELQAKSIDNFNRTMNDPIANQRIIDSITKNLPAYTQYMDVLKKMQNHGKLPGGVKEHEVLVKTD